MRKQIEFSVVVKLRGEIEIRPSISGPPKYSIDIYYDKDIEKVDVFKSDIEES